MSNLSITQQFDLAVCSHALKNLSREELEKLCYDLMNSTLVSQNVAKSLLAEKLNIQELL